MQVVYEMPFERHVERTREYRFSVSFDSTIWTSRALERISSELENSAQEVHLTPKNRRWRLIGDLLAIFFCAFGVFGHFLEQIWRLKKKVTQLHNTVVCGREAGRESICNDSRFFENRLLPKKSDLLDTCPPGWPFFFRSSEIFRHRWWQLLATRTDSEVGDFWQLSWLLLAPCSPKYLATLVVVLSHSASGLLVISTI